MAIAYKERKGGTSANPQFSNPMPKAFWTRLVKARNTAIEKGKGTLTNSAVIMAGLEAVEKDLGIK
jgi:hypothetical protein